jgi:hypothetical protein
MRRSEILALPIPIFSFGACLSTNYNISRAGANEEETIALRALYSRIVPTSWRWEMSVLQHLSVIALRGAVNAATHGVGDAAFHYLVDHFTNHTNQLTRALQTANDRAWQTLESALAGPSLWDYLKKKDDKVIRVRISG